MNEIKDWPWIECGWCGEPFQVPSQADTDGYCDDRCYDEQRAHPELAFAVTRHL